MPERVPECARFIGNSAVQSVKTTYPTQWFRLIIATIRNATQNCPNRRKPLRLKIRPPGLIRFHLY